MKRTILITLFNLFAMLCMAQQYYLRGEVRDENGNALQNVVILHHSSGYTYRTGQTGSFGIVTNREADTLSFSYDGFEKAVMHVHQGRFITVKLKAAQGGATTIRRNKLASLTKDLARNDRAKVYAGDETYTSIVENDFVEASRYPNTAVALNIDRASYSNIRRFINLGMEVPPDAVRIEEMLNYFNFGYTSPPSNELFQINTTLTGCPWTPENQLLFVNIYSRKLNLDALPPSNLVFLVDISGSMDMANRLPLLKSAFHMLANNLREKDTVSIVVYGGTVGVMLHPTSGKEKEKITKAIDELTPGGSTPGESGIRLAYNIAKNHFIKDGNNRVILATDGDFNVGARTEEELDELISRHRQSGIYLTCLGVGMGNYKDSKIQTLARKGNGNFAYIDGYQEAEKIIMKEFTQTLYTVADDVYMNIVFNPALVKSYRLIGFDNKLGAIQDTSSIIEGGEIGSGQTMIAAFEIIPAKQASESSALTQFAEVMLQYKKTNNTERHERKFKIYNDYIPLKNVDPIYRFASSVIMFGAILNNSAFTKDISWGDVIMYAGEAANPTDINQHQFLELVMKAKNFYSKYKKKKGNRQ